jgi:hypothetical protein
MWIIGTIGSVALIFLILRDGFETMVLPRRVAHRFMLARTFYTTTWAIWRALVRLWPERRREPVLSLYGPLSLLAIFTTWVTGLVVGFGLLHWSLGTALQGPSGEATLATYLYLSGTTFFTLGYGDVTPLTTLGRLLAVLESGLGLGFLAVTVGYLPVCYQAFSRREVSISLLDARAGSPPSASQCLVRLARSGNLGAVAPLLSEWERWSAELLESHLSFPMLSYYRSQHDNQSWLGALTVMLDTCAILLAGTKGPTTYQTQLTFAMARHALVDMAMVLGARPDAAAGDRLPAPAAHRLRELLAEAGLKLVEGPAFLTKLAELRGMYEPFVEGLARYLLWALPPIVPAQDSADNWQRSAWMARAPGIGSLAVAGDDHAY